MTKETVLIRVYILSVDNIVRVDSSSLSDPYLVIKCGDQVVSVNYYKLRNKTYIWKIVLKLTSSNCTNSKRSFPERPR